MVILAAVLQPTCELHGTREINMASPEATTAINMFRAAKAELQSLTTVDECRIWYEGFTAQFDVPEDTVVEQVGAGGVAAEWISVPGASDEKVVIYLHGGGYIVGSTRTHRVPMAYLSRASGARVLVLNFRLAPEHPFSAAIEDRSGPRYCW